jgi:hypothetical protein
MALKYNSEPPTATWKTTYFLRGFPRLTLSEILLVGGLEALTSISLEFKDMISIGRSI